jgi:hypothetical protein
VDSLFTLPLHEAVCVPFCSADTAHITLHLRLEFGQIILKFYSCFRVMQVLSVRYNTYVLFYKQEQFSQILNSIDRERGYLTA